MSSYKFSKVIVCLWLFEKLIVLFATKQTRRKLHRVNFRKEFWNFYWREEENWPIADGHVPSNNPRMSLRKLIDPGFVSFLKWRIARGLGPVVQRPISANPGLNFNLGFLFFCSKASYRIIFCILLRASNHQIVDKKNTLNLLFKPSNLNSISH